MATLVESTEMETLGVQSNTGTSPTSSSPSQHFNDSKFYLLVVIGEIVTEDHLKCAIADIEKGKMVGGRLWGGRPTEHLHNNLSTDGKRRSCVLWLEKSLLMHLDFTHDALRTKMAH